MDKWRQSEFLDHDEDPLGPLANLVDIILVFACGLIAALVAFSPELQQHFDQSRKAIRPQQNISVSRELPELPPSLDRGSQPGDGYEPVGQVYRDPQSGKLILIGD